MLNILLRYGADVFQKIDKDLDAFEFAKAYGTKEMIDMINKKLREKKINEIFD